MEKSNAIARVLVRSEMGNWFDGVLCWWIRVRQQRGKIIENRTELLPPLTSSTYLVSTSLPRSNIHDEPPLDSFILSI